jgi:nicotinamidase-related amidase
MKNILIVVDMQNDFIDGSLGTKEAVAIVPNVIKKIAEYRARGDEIIFTADTHFDDYLSTNEGKHLPVMHCIKGTDGWKISSLLDVGNSKVIEKPTFGYLEWKNVIEDVDELCIELVGLCTDICVVSNALILKATFPSATIKVDSTCCAGVTPASHSSALSTMQMCQIEVK